MLAGLALLCTHILCPLKILHHRHRRLDAAEAMDQAERARASPAAGRGVDALAGGLQGACAPAQPAMPADESCQPIQHFRGM